MQGKFILINKLWIRRKYSVFSVSKVNDKTTIFRVIMRSIFEYRVALRRNPWRLSLKLNFESRT